MKIARSRTHEFFSAQGICDLKKEVLPAGLTLDASTGIVSGNPTKAGVSNVQYIVSDSSSPAVTATQTYSFKVAAEQFNFPTTILKSGLVHEASDQTLHASGGTPP